MDFVGEVNRKKAFTEGWGNEQDVAGWQRMIG